MLAQRRGLWTDIKLTLFQRLVVAGMCLVLDCMQTEGHYVRGEDWTRNGRRKIYYIKNRNFCFDSTICVSTGIKIVKLFIDRYFNVSKISTFL